MLRASYSMLSSLQTPDTVLAWSCLLGDGVFKPSADAYQNALGNWRAIEDEPASATVTAVVVWVLRQRWRVLVAVHKLY